MQNIANQALIRHAYCGDSLGKGLPKATTGRKGVMTIDSTVEKL